MTATIGQLSEFQPQREKVSDYLERVSLYFEANDVAEDKQVAVLLTAIGGETYALLTSLLSPAKPRDKSYREITAVLKAHFEPKPIIIAERFHFHRRQQAQTETIAEYVAELRRLASTCEFNDYLEQALRDRLVCGLRHGATQKRLLTEPKLTLTKAIEIAQSLEAAEHKSRQINEPSQEVLRLTRKAAQRPPRPEQSQPTGVCYRCGGTDHSAPHCRYKETQCHKCKKKGHLAKVCQSKKSQGKRPERLPTKWVEEEEAPIYLVRDKSHPPFTVELMVNEKPVTFEVDTGAAVTILSQEVYQHLFPNLKLDPSSMLLKSYTGDQVKVLGEVQVAVSYGEQKGNYTLYVVKGNNSCLLGRNWLKHIRLDWKRIASLVMKEGHQLESLFKKYNLVFKEDLGTLQSSAATLHVKPNSTPKFFKPRPVPYAIREAMELELDRLESTGIIEKVEHSDWAAPVVPVPKGDGKLRLCGDYKVTINSQLLVDQYPLPRPEDLMARLAGRKKFSKLDLSQAYQQVPLDQESRKYVTINTIKGLYQYTRLPFGIASAPSIFQRLMDTLLQGIPGIICYLDDILVTGSNDEDHFKNLEEVLKRLMDAGLRLKKSKCALMQDSVQYLGHRIDAQGVHTTPDKIAAIQKAPTPRNVKQLRSFLGLIQYYGKFIANMSSLLHPMYKLLKAKVRWKWDDQCNKAFENAKQKLMEAPVLAHYDPTRSLKLATDASAYGIGAVLSHCYEDGSERPIAFTSRTLTAAEKNYAQIDKEALALIYGVQKFHVYLYGRKFTLVTDHKPLVSILGPTKGIPLTAAARLQRWALFLAGYQYQIEFKPTLKHGNADGLSRLPLSSSTEDNVDDVETTLFNIAQIEYLPVTAEQVQRATAKDALLSRVLQFTKLGWPTAVDESLLGYFNRRHEISVEGGCLLWGIRVIVPEKLQKRVLDELHKDHLGIVRMKSKARSYVWWPGVDQNIEDLVRSCLACQEVRNTPPTAPLHPWLWPTKPWRRIHIDFAGPFLKRMFLLVTDAHSKWPEIIEMASTTSTRTIEELRRLFAAYGLPEQVVTDNGPQFVSQEFANFMKLNGIKHIKTVPYHPASNGAVERLVQTFKKSMMCKLQKGVTISQLLSSFLLSYRTTPHSTTKVTPAELFMNRNIRTRLDLIQPDIESTVSKAQGMQKAHHDTKVKETRYLIGEKVMAKNYRHGPKWLPGVIVEQLGTLTFLVQIDNGMFWKRHVDQLRHRGHSSKDKTESETPCAYTESNDENLNESCEASNGAVSDTTTEARQNETGTSATSSVVSARRYPDRVRRPPIRYQTD